MKIRQFEIWLADINPDIRRGARSLRPVIVVQTDLLNKEHPSTIVCPITTHIKPDAEILRVHLKKSKFGLQRDGDVMVDQVRAIDNTRMVQKIGDVDTRLRELIRENLEIVLGV